MNEIFLLLFDYFRGMFGVLIADFLFCEKAVPRKNHFWIRVAVCGIICSMQALAWYPLYEKLNNGFSQNMHWGLIYIIGSGIIQIGSICMCFEIELAQALFRCLLGRATELIATVIIRYLVVMMWFPELPEKQFGVYVLLMLYIYILVYGIIYYAIVRTMRRGNNQKISNNNSKRTILMYLGVYFGMIGIIAGIQIVCESILRPMKEYSNLMSIYTFILYFCIFVLFVLSIMMIFIMSNLYEVGILQNEREILEQLVHEKKVQYEFIKENTEMINQKCHEIKHQLKKLETAEDAERKRMIHDVRNAVNFYDAVVKTGNEVLDTILTEKSVRCANRGIKFSCMVHMSEVNHIKLMDLYTMLDVTLNHAIESTTVLADNEKKLISLMITMVGDMIYISVENYFDKKMKFRKGYPVSIEKDIKNIQLIVRKYGGDIQFYTENQVCQLQIILPGK